jgi:very-short-patch-repair endonuclease
MPMKANKNNYYGYNSNLQPFAIQLRKSMTKAEACLWKYVLRAGMMKGYQFRRQRPVLYFIADFMCKELMLVIEVDGDIHLLEEVQEKDKLKDKILQEVGFTILRYTNDEVLHHIEQVTWNIESWIEESDFPSPNPRLRRTKEE